MGQQADAWAFREAHTTALGLTSFTAQISAIGKINQRERREVTPEVVLETVLETVLEVVLLADTFINYFEPENRGAAHRIFDRRRLHRTYPCRP